MFLGLSISEPLRITENSSFLGGRVYYVPIPNSCGLDFDSFLFVVSDGTSSSNETEVRINVLCTPGKHIHSLAAVIIICSFTGITVLICIAVFVWTLYLRRRLKGEKSIFLLIMLFGFMISLSYNFFEFAPLDDHLCGFRTWFTAFGAMLVASYALSSPISNQNSGQLLCVRSLSGKRPSGCYRRGAEVE